MRTFGSSRAGRPGGSRTTGRRGPWRRASRSGSQTTGIALAPDGDGRLAEGVLVETHLLARLLGVRLLRVDGVVTIAPARVAASSVDPRAVPMTSTMELGTGLERAAHLLRECERRTSTR
ncbi:MAG TPA: hypothetical protein VFI21_09415 [Nocardioides sp.]|nr:hypothetical protein [Nocardioides sp.]